MKKAFFYLSLILLVLIISSCNDCKEPDCPKLTAEESSWFPYNEYDSLLFKHTASDSIILVRLSNYGNSSNLYTPTNGDECNKYCRASMGIYSRYYIDQIEIFSGDFVISRVKEGFYVVISPSTSIDVSRPEANSYFDLRYAIKLDSININGNLLEDVYHYTCKPQQEELAETYVKKGMGLVKIVLRDGQEFELVEHIKAD
ncbi:MULTISPECIES: hypothetical protein [unclassified Lentimicrobium]|uniref:hypothetical protein n=1 Tax=unclassified Lentimicrobium TaxID=2677434 RepID=UPI001553BADB|nr:MULTISPECIES: hypothetical protein [unclassified Lentimicrobium]NPD46046.1 hypothetical protein [Lentimicrobium sp. S6]NPD84950.1 hypothetical protein [Lentimicrobium sp. L6]